VSRAGRVGEGRVCGRSTPAESRLWVGSYGCRDLLLLERDEVIKHRISFVAQFFYWRDGH